MIRSLWTGATGMKAQQQNVNTIANNLANINTVGFKKSVAHFQDLLYQSINRAGTLEASDGQTRPTSTQVGLGVNLSSIDKIFSQGETLITENPLDISIEGEGFFKIALPGGADFAYTRDGSFKLDSTGRIVTDRGNLLEPQITISPEAVAISIAPDGTLQSVDSGGNVLDQAQIQIYNFINPNGLMAMGDNLFQVTPGAGPEIEGVPGEQGLGKLRQSTLERSNVTAIDSMTSLIEGQRAYEFNAKSITTSDEMLQQINTLKR